MEPIDKYCGLHSIHRQTAESCSLLGAQDATTRLWDVRHTAKSFATLKAHMGAVRSLRFSPDGRTLAVAEPADFVDLYDVAAGYDSRQEVRRRPYSRRVAETGRRTSVSTSGCYLPKNGVEQLSLAGQLGMQQTFAFTTR